LSTDRAHPVARLHRPHGSQHWTIRSPAIRRAIPPGGPEQAFAPPAQGLGRHLHEQEDDPVQQRSSHHPAASYTHALADGGTLTIDGSIDLTRFSDPVITERAERLNRELHVAATRARDELWLGRLGW
jgi:hypothetical protein